MVFLNGLHIEALAAECANTVNGSSSAWNRCDAWNAMIDCCPANRFFVEKGFAAEWRIDDQMNFPALDVVHNVRPALVHFVNRLNFDSGISENLGGPARRDDFEADLDEIRRNS